MATKCVGCGLDVDDDGTLVVKTETWPYPCNITAHGSKLYCDPTTGSAVGDPLPQNDHHYNSIYRDPSGSDATVNDGGTRTENTEVTIDLTDYCRPVRILVFRGYVWDINATPGDNYQVHTELFLDGVAVPDTFSQVMRESSEPAVPGGGSRRVASRNVHLGNLVTLPPGAVHKLKTVTTFNNIGATPGNSPITLNRIGAYIYATVLEIV